MGQIHSPTKSTAQDSFLESHKPSLYNILYVRTHQRCPIKKTFSKLLQNSQEKTCVGVPLLINILLHRSFSVNFTKLLKNIFFTDNLWATTMEMEILTISRICWKVSRDTLVGNKRDVSDNNNYWDLFFQEMHSFLTSD